MNAHSDRGVRVVIADDSALIREGLTEVMRARGVEVVRAVGTVDDLLRAVATDRPDLAIVDIRLPPGYGDEGLRAARTIRDRWRCPVLVLSQYLSVTFAMSLLASAEPGGIGYLLKDRVGSLDQFIDAVRIVAAGGSVLDPQIVAQLVGGRRDRRLSARELDVLRLMAEGKSNLGIARALDIRESTVEKHCATVLQKLRIAESPEQNRRVLAVLSFLTAAGPGGVAQAESAGG